jgi:hypothetical protein
MLQALEHSGVAEEIDTFNYLNKIKDFDLTLRYFMTNVLNEIAAVIRLDHHITAELLTEYLIELPDECTDNFIFCLSKYNILKRDYQDRALAKQFDIELKRQLEE